VGVIENGPAAFTGSRKNVTASWWSEPTQAGSGHSTWSNSKSYPSAIAIMLMTSVQKTIATALSLTSLLLMRRTRAFQRRSASVLGWTWRRANQVERDAGRASRDRRLVAMVGEIRDMFIDHMTVVTTDGWVSDAVRAFMKGGEHGLRRYTLRWIDGRRTIWPTVSMRSQTRLRARPSGQCIVIGISR
jgi:hypothetical protein